MTNKFKDALDKLEFADNGNPNRLYGMTYRTNRDNKLSDWIEENLALVKDILEKASQLHENPYGDAPPEPFQSTLSPAHLAALGQMLNLE